MNSTRSSESYDAERASVAEKHERSMNKAKEDEEKTLTSAKKEYQERLKELKEEANAEVRKLKEDSYDSSGKRFTTLERENLEEKRRLTDAYEAALAKAHQSREEQEDVYEEKLDRALNDASDRTRSQVQTQKKEFSRIAEENRREANEAKKVYEAEIAKEKVRSQRGTEQIVADNNASTNKAMAAHSAMYDEYLKENQKHQKAALTEKNREIQELKNTGDVKKISPEARRKIEETYQARFQTDLQAERASNAATVAAMRNRDQKYQQDLRDGYANKFHELGKDVREQNLAEKTALVSGYKELESRSENTKQLMQDKQVDQSKRSYQKHAGELTLQQKRNSEQLKEQRASLLDEKFKEKIELENKQRATERELGYKLTDTRRDFEKKLVEQKDQHEQEMSFAKFEFDKKLQDQQRTAKRLLDDRVRAYETQIKTMESQHKEHKRLLTEHYEEELDSMKRTNARITQTKS